MGLFDQFINVDIKKDMGIAGLTDEFFCVYLNNIFEKYNRNILVVVNSLYEANQLYSSLKNYNKDFSSFVSIAGGIIIFLLCLDELSSILIYFSEIYMSNKEKQKT